MANVVSENYKENHIKQGDLYMERAAALSGNKAIAMYRKARGEYALAQDQKKVMAATDRILEIQGVDSAQAAREYRCMASEAAVLEQPGETAYNRKAEAHERQAARNESLTKKLEAAGKS